VIEEVVVVLELRLLRLLLKELEELLLRFRVDGLRAKLVMVLVRVKGVLLGLYLFSSGSV
jgi:hypothetical protein